MKTVIQREHQKHVFMRVLFLLILGLYWVIFNYCMFERENTSNTHAFQADFFIIAITLPSLCISYLLDSFIIEETFSENESGQDLYLWISFASFFLTLVVCTYLHSIFDWQAWTLWSSIFIRTIIYIFLFKAFKSVSNLSFKSVIKMFLISGLSFLIVVGGTLFSFFVAFAISYP